MDKSMTDQKWHVGVLIPARNEEELLPRCLRSVLIAVALLPQTVTADIIVVADKSTDRTMQTAARLLRGRGIAVRAEAGMVGAARALAAAFALKRRRRCLHRSWLANTDADCVTPPTWLADQLHLANQGAEAIAGTVGVDSFSEHGPEAAERFRASYVVRADGSHPHVHGANLGVRADAYLQVGGWRDLSNAEDHDLWGRLLHNGYSTVSTARIEVATSGRRNGRAPHGFAGALAAHSQAPA